MSTAAASDETFEAIRLLIQMRAEAVRRGDVVAYRRYIAVSRVLEHYERVWGRQIPQLADR